MYMRIDVRQLSVQKVKTVSVRKCLECTTFDKIGRRPRQLLAPLVNAFPPKLN